MKNWLHRIDSKINEKRLPRKHWQKCNTYPRAKLAHRILSKVVGYRKVLEHRYSYRNCDHSDKIRWNLVVGSLALGKITFHLEFEFSSYLSISMWVRAKDGSSCLIRLRIRMEKNGDHIRALGEVLVFVPSVIIRTSIGWYLHLATRPPKVCSHFTIWNSNLKLVHTNNKFTSILVSFVRNTITFVITLLVSTTVCETVVHWCKITTTYQKVFPFH